MGYEMTGAIKQVGEVQTFASGFTKIQFVITNKEKYPQDVIFECVKDRTALLDGVMGGDEVTVHFDIRGNEYGDRHYVNLNCWKLDKGPTGPADPGDDMPESAASNDEVPF